MKIFAISDLHLSFAQEKEMDIFGTHWENHWEKIKMHWQELVKEEDIVLIAGDISWAMHFSDVIPDLEKIQALPGYKIMIRGNHDYWHGSLTKTRALLQKNAFFLQNDAVQIGGYTFVGSRGWKLPSDHDFSKEDEKIYKRELERLRLSLSAGQRLGGKMIALLHYPPVSPMLQDTAVSLLLEEFGVKTVIFGHIHGNEHKYAKSFLKNGITYWLTSCDQIDFSPICISLGFR